MTTTDELSRQHRRDLIAFATRGQLGRSGKAALVVLVIVVLLMLALKSLAADRRDARRAYCGCAASIKLFGRIRPELNLAANWLRKFPRTRPAPMMAAARSGHVMVLLEPAGGDQWKVYDGNSGHGLTRIHIRSIKGYSVVDPFGTRFAHL
jgi:hypothetical protein